MEEGREFWIASRDYEELSEADRERLASYTERRSWCVMGRGTEHRALWVKAKPDCPQDGIIGLLL